MPMPMPIPNHVLAILLLLVLLTPAALSLPAILPTAPCSNGSILGGGDAETDMESETSRRILLTPPLRRYISYETLRRDMVPCTRPGDSYYNCGGGRANPYSRGCEIITGCARIIKDDRN